MNTNGEFSEPAEREGVSGGEPTRRYELEPREEYEAAGQNQAAPTEIVQVHIPSGQPNLPLPRPMGVVVRRRRLALLYLLIALLLVVIGGMAYAMIANPHNALVAANSTTSATATPQASSTATATATSPGATDGANPSGSASGAPGASGSASDGSSATSAATNPSSGGAGFTPPFGSEYLPSPVDGDGNVNTGQDVHVSNVDYASSVTFYCPTNGLIDWNVAGYRTFSAEFGIPDDARSATGVSDTITFADQNGKTLNTATTSIGQPTKISFPVSGVDRLIMSCSRQGSNDSTNNRATLGNASVSTS